MFSSSGALICGTMSNVFLVREGRLYTPRVDRCGVAGIMRQVVLAVAADLRLAAQEGGVDAGDPEAAGERVLPHPHPRPPPVRELQGPAPSPRALPHPPPEPPPPPPPGPRPPP